MPIRSTVCCCIAAWCLLQIRQGCIVSQLLAGCMSLLFVDPLLFRQSQKSRAKRKLNLWIRVGGYVERTKSRSGTGTTGIVHKLLVFAFILSPIQTASTAILISTIENNNPENDYYHILCRYDPSIFKHIMFTRNVVYYRSKSSLKWSVFDLLLVFMAGGPGVKFLTCSHKSWNSGQCWNWKRTKWMLWWKQLRYCWRIDKLSKLALPTYYLLIHSNLLISAKTTNKTVLWVHIYK